MIILREKHKKLNNIDLALIVGGLLTSLAIIFWPFN
jgi:hypothetical protein